MLNYVEDDDAMFRWEVFNLSALMCFAFLPPADQMVLIPEVQGGAHCVLCCRYMLRYRQCLGYTLQCLLQSAVGAGSSTRITSCNGRCSRLVTNQSGTLGSE